MRKHFSQTSGSQRLAYGLGAGLLTAAVPVSLPLGWATRGLLGWCVGVAVYLGLAWWLCHSFDARQTRERAQAQDEPSIVIFLLLLLAALACVLSITLMMRDIPGLQGGQRVVLIALLVLALAVSWLFIQSLFAFHYAHRYYQSNSAGDREAYGLKFPGDTEPDYFDFMYYSHVVGMTSQVSDVQAVSGEMRRITLVHSVLAFGFNMLVFALGINVVAGSIK